MLRFAANISMMFTEWALPDRFAAARHAGFEGVEMQFPYDYPADLLAGRAAAAGVEVVLINAPVRAPDYPFGFASHPEASELFDEAVGRAADYAAALGAGLVNVLAGRGHRPLLAERLAGAQERIASARVLIEALSPVDAPDYAVPSLEAALALALDCAAPIGLQFDIYHAAASGADPVPMAAWALPYIGHVQFADWPGRHEPGTGTAPIEAALDRLAADGYAGWVGAEYHPSGATVHSLGWLAPWQERYGRC